MTGRSPQLVSLLLCDRAFQEAGTLKWHISGAFDTVNVSEFPAAAQPFSAFVALSDFGGDAMVQLVIRDQEGAVVKAVRGKIPRIPLGLFQYVFPFPDVEFRSAGVHTLELLAGEHVVALRSFRVQKAAPDPEEEQAQGQELVEQHKEQLIKDAMEIWEKHPDAIPVGLIASPQAAGAPWFRQAFESLFGSPPPQMTFVGILDREHTLRLLGDQAEEAEKWLDSILAEEGRVLPVLIVMMGGFQFAVHKIDPLL
ncbi:MAG: hypothetical protein ACE5F1_18225 [Planctomycetota bacterium]